MANSLKKCDLIFIGEPRIGVKPPKYCSTNSVYTYGVGLTETREVCYAWYVLKQNHFFHVLVTQMCTSVKRAPPYSLPRGGLKYSSAWNALNWVSTEIGGECPVMTSTKNILRVMKQQRFCELCYTFKKYFLNCGSMVFPILKSIYLHPDLLENLNSKKAHTILIRF